MPELGEIKKARDIGIKGGNNWMWCACEMCGRKRWVMLKFGMPIYALCISCCKKKKGALNHNWKGGRRKTQSGYILIWIDEDDFFYPMASHQYVSEHRLLMAKYLNRCLLPWEVVHHKNGIKDDNGLENLQLLPTPRYHLVDQLTKAHIGRLEKRLDAQDKQIRLLKWQISELNGKHSLYEKFIGE